MVVRVVLRPQVTYSVSFSPEVPAMTDNAPELGACNVAEKGANTTYNDWSWNEVANVIFLDREQTLPQRLTADKYI
jgi:hypothetical protein